METKLFVECNCGGEALAFEVNNNDFIDKEKYPEADDIELWISLWTQGYRDPKTISFWQKIKLAFHVLEYGTLYSDQIIIDMKKVETIRNYLNSILQEGKLN